MQIADAQREIRQGYLGGFMGQLVSGVLRLASAGGWFTAAPLMGFAFAGRHIAEKE